MTDVAWQGEFDELATTLQLGFDLDVDEPDDEEVGRSPGPNEARKSIDFVLETALEYGRIGSWAQLVHQVAAFWPYKPYNALLVLLQRPGATFVLPAHEWGERFRRRIRPNEQPLVLLRPGGPVMFLFDVSQTEETPDSRPLPGHLRDPFAMPDAKRADVALRWVVENAKADGVRVTEGDFGQTLAGHIQPTGNGGVQTVERPKGGSLAFPIRYETVLNAGHTPTVRLASLAHELGHLYCGHLGTHDVELWPARTGLTLEQRELEAESVAVLAFERLFPGVPLPAYLDQFFASVDDRPQVDVERVLTAAGRVIETADRFVPRRKVRTRAERLSSRAARRSG